RPPQPWPAGARCRAWRSPRAWRRRRRRRPYPRPSPPACREDPRGGAGWPRGGGGCGPGSASSVPEGIEGPAAVLEGEEGEIGAGAAVAVAQHDVARDGLEAGAEVLPRLDQHVLLPPRIDAAVGEDAHVEGLAAALRHHDLHRARIEHGGATHAP